MKMTKEKLNDNSCNECNENYSTLKLKYNNIIYWLCDDCYIKHLKKSDLGLGVALDYKIKQFIKKYIVKNKIKAKKIDYQSQFEEGVYFKAQKEFLEKQKIGSIKSWWSGDHAWIYWYICDCCDLLHKKGFFKKSK